jgi:hypothetical protein
MIGEEETNKTQKECLQEEITNTEGGTHEAPEAEKCSQEEEALNKKPLEEEDKSLPLKEISSVLDNEKTNVEYKAKSPSNTLATQENMLSDPQQGEMGKEHGKYTSPINSPNWDSLEEETITEIELQVTDQDKEKVVEPTKEHERIAKTVRQNKGGEPVRQSERIKRQEKGGMKIADKADLAARKKNLEGNDLNHKNSFAVLDNLTLVDKFSKMGGNSKSVILENFDIIKDLEMARNNMKERLENLNKEDAEIENEILPLEEMRYIEWRSDSSDLSDI